MITPQKIVNFLEQHHLCIRKQLSTKVLSFVSDYENF